MFCGVKLLMSAPACCSVVLTHREIVDLLTTLCGLEKLMNSVDCSPLRGFVLLMHSTIVVTIHKSGSSGNVANSISAWCRPGLSCVVRDILPKLNKWIV